MQTKEPGLHGSSEVAERVSHSATSDRPYKIVLKGAAFFFGAVVLIFVWSVLHAAWPALKQNGYHLITGTSWVAGGNGPFGAFSLILDTLITTLIALLIAVPIGISSALALLFLVPPKFRTLGASLVELLAAVPSVVYGLWGLWYLTPWLSHTVQPFLAGLTGSNFPFNGPQEGFSLLLTHCATIPRWPHWKQLPIQWPTRRFQPSFGGHCSFGHDSSNDCCNLSRCNFSCAC